MNLATVSITTRRPAFPRNPWGVVRSLDAHDTAVAQHPVMGIFAGTVQVGTGIGCTRN